MHIYFFLLDIHKPIIIEPLVAAILHLLGLK